MYTLNINCFHIQYVIKSYTSTKQQANCWYQFLSNIWSFWKVVFYLLTHLSLDLDAFLNYSQWNYCGLLGNRRLFLKHSRQKSDGYWLGLRVSFANTTQKQTNMKRNISVAHIVGIRDITHARKFILQVAYLRYNWFVLVYVVVPRQYYDIFMFV